MSVSFPFVQILPVVPMVLRIKGGIIKKVQKNASGLLDVLKVETIFLQRQYVTFGV